MRMKQRPLAMLAVGLVLVLAVAGASAKGLEPDLSSKRSMPVRPPDGETDARGARADTFWIFDADFSDLSGDNAGWTVFDRSGTIAVANYWHHDTIRMRNLPHLGDSTWWCGTENVCWRQPRGYANDWVQILERSFPEVEANTDPGDPLTLDWDQRFAIEHDYDYGYVEISTDGGDSWNEIYYANNTGFSGQPGASKDWDDPVHGHQSFDISAYAGIAFDLRFRFESDEAYSSQDQANNPPQNSVKDGAWQLDNITLTGPGGVFWLDDAESGNMGWEHPDTEASGQTGVVWWRGQFEYDFETGRDFTCANRADGTWMYACVDPFTSEMVDNEYTWLMSPPIDISGAPKLVSAWDQWADMTEASGDLHNLYLASDDLESCVTDPDGFIEEEPGWWFADPFWYTEVDDWDAFAGNAWLAILWAVQSDTTEANGEHWAGLIHNYQRVGIPSGDAGTAWEHHAWEGFNDWFQDDLTEALLDTASIKVKDDDGVVEVNVMASNDGGVTWEAYPCRRQDPSDPQSNWWYAPPPANQMTPGSEIRYYFEGIDGVGTVTTDPDRAPDETYEMSILPILGSVSEPGILLVDKHGRLTPGEQRDFLHSSEYYYREMLEILGYEYDTYDVEVPSGSRLSDGPDTTGMKYYDTQIWFTNDFNSRTLNPPDQSNLVQWLNQAEQGKVRNLLLTGNDIGYDLIETENETLAFYETWLASDFVDNAVGAVTIDSIPGIENHTGDYEFMTYLDGEAIVRGGCPILNNFDVVRPFAGIGGTEIVADYIMNNETRRPAGVAYTHGTYGYKTVNLGFGMEFIMDGTVGDPGNYTSDGYYHTGLQDRLNLMQNVMDYFGEGHERRGQGRQNAPRPGASGGRVRTRPVGRRERRGRAVRERRLLLPHRRAGLRLDEKDAHVEVGGRKPRAVRAVRQPDARGKRGRVRSSPLSLTAARRRLFVDVASRPDGIKFGFSAARRNLKRSGGVIFGGARDHPRRASTSTGALRDTDHANDETDHPFQKGRGIGV